MLKKKSGLGAQMRKLPRGPDLAELHQLLSQCMEQRGKVVRLSWRGDTLTPFTLEVVCHVKNGNAQWKLFSEKDPKPLFDYTSVDVLLVYNLVAANCAEQQQPKRDSALEERVASASHNRMPAVSSGDPPLPRPRYAEPGEQKPFELNPTDGPAHVRPVETPSFAVVPPRPVLTSHDGPIPREGTIQSGSVAVLLQDIARAGETGRLDVRCKDLTATVFIQSGKPVDATANDVVGDEAIIEMLTWQEGTFTFEHQLLRSNQTVSETIESLVAQSNLLATRSNRLKEVGMLPTSTYMPTNTMLSQGDFLARVQENCPCDADTISRVYCSLEGKRTFEELSRFLHISRIQLVHIIFHLYIKELIKIVNDVRPKSALTLSPRVIDNSAIQSIMMSLRRAETGLFIYPAFLYFLEQEYFRSYRSRAAFSVAVFEIRQKKVVDDKLVKRVLHEKALMDAVLRISNIKRHVDMMAHYDAYDYALLLPSTRPQGAEIFIGRVIEALRAKPLGGEVDPSQLAIAFGCCSVPDDFKDMSSLLGGADLALEQARKKGQDLVMYRDIKSQVG